MTAFSLASIAIIAITSIGAVVVLSCLRMVALCDIACDSIAINRTMAFSDPDDPEDGDEDDYDICEHYLTEYSTLQA